MGENEGDFVQKKGGSEVFAEIAVAVEKAVGRPGWAVMATFGAAVIVDPATGQLAVSTASWPFHPAKQRHVRKLLHDWLDAADAADQADEG